MCITLRRFLSSLFKSSWQYFPTPPVENAFLIPLGISSFLLCHRFIDYIREGLFQDIPFIERSAFIPIPWGFKYYGFTVQREVERKNDSHSLFPRFSLVIYKVILYYMHFRSTHVFKNVILNNDFIESVQYFVETCHFNDGYPSKSLSSRCIYISVFSYFLYFLFMEFENLYQQSST